LLGSSQPTHFFLNSLLLFFSSFNILSFLIPYFRLGTGRIILRLESRYLFFFPRYSTAIRRTMFSARKFLDKQKEQRIVLFITVRSTLETRDRKHIMTVTLTREKNYISTDVVSRLLGR